MYLELSEDSLDADAEWDEVRVVKKVLGAASLLLCGYFVRTEVLQYIY